MIEPARRLRALGFKLVCTSGTARVLAEAGIEVETVRKLQEGRPNLLDKMANGEIQFIFNTPERQRCPHRRRPHPLGRRRLRRPLRHDDPRLPGRGAGVGSLRQKPDSSRPHAAGLGQDGTVSRCGRAVMNGPGGQRRPANQSRIVLGSRSPRRLELLRQIVPAESIEVLPPRSAEEAGFAGLHDWPSIESRLVEIALVKCRDVLEQLAERASAKLQDAATIVIAADTVVVATQADGSLTVLGQPPSDPSWPEVVGRWFREFYAGKTHTVATALCVARFPENPESTIETDVVTSAITFREDVEPWLDWYLQSGEPLGKAGGYGLQGAGSVFVSRVDGSISNVVGLPLEALLDNLRRSTDSA